MRRDAGFTLLEVMIAFIIAAMALAVLFRGAVQGLGVTDTAFHYEEALSRARSHLAAVGPDLVASDRQGDDGSGYHWHVTIAPEAGPAAPPGRLSNVPLPGLYAVRVVISWDSGHGTRQVLLRSERLGPAARTGP